MKVLSISLVVSPLLLSVPVHAQDTASMPPIDLRVGGAPLAVQVDSSVHVTLSGWMRVDYGFGSRFGPAAGHDELGISKMALKTDAQYEDFNLIGSGARSSRTCRPTRPSRISSSCATTSAARPAR